MMDPPSNLPPLWHSSPGRRCSSLALQLPGRDHQSQYLGRALPNREEPRISPVPMNVITRVSITPENLDGGVARPGCHLGREHFCLSRLTPEWEPKFLEPRRV